MTFTATPQPSPGHSPEDELAEARICTPELYVENSRCFPPCWPTQAAAPNRSWTRYRLVGLSFEQLRRR
ncbi:MAG: hypothetical protein R2856_22230 [Caldilineaceae bacterium]